MSFRHSISTRSFREPRLVLCTISAAVLSALAACGGGNGTSEEAVSSEAVAFGAQAIAADKVKTIFVDANNGNDANKGADARSAVRTIERALALAKSGDTVKLAAGSYTQSINGERYPLQVPNGVNIAGTLQRDGSQGTHLSPLTSAGHETGLVFAGNGSLKDVDLVVFGVALTTNAGAQTFDNVLLQQNVVALEATGSAKSTFLRSKLSIDPNGPNKGVVVAGQASVVVDAGRFEGLSSACNVLGIGIAASESGLVTVKNGAQFVNVPGRVMQLLQNSSATINAAVMTRQSDDACQPAPSIDAAGSSTLKATALQVNALGGKSAVGIAVREDAGVTLINSSVSGHLGTGAGISVSNGTSARHLVVNGGSIKANGIGIRADFTGLPHIDLNKVTIDDNVFGIIVLNPALTMTNTTLARNQIGLHVTGALDQVEGSFVNLSGTGIGGNTIVDNTVTGVSHFGTGTIFAERNLWMPSEQVMDAQGHAPRNVTLRSGGAHTQGLNFRLADENESIRF